MRGLLYGRAPLVEGCTGFGISVMSLPTLCKPPQLNRAWQRAIDAPHEAEGIR